jgi:hypothetical protein
VSIAVPVCLRLCFLSLCLCSTDSTGYQATVRNAWQQLAAATQTTSGHHYDASAVEASKLCLDYLFQQKSQSPSALPTVDIGPLLSHPSYEVRNTTLKYLKKKMLEKTQGSSYLLSQVGNVAVRQLLFHETNISCVKNLFKLIPRVYPPHHHHQTQSFASILATVVTAHQDNTNSNSNKGDGFSVLWRVVLQWMSTAAKRYAIPFIGFLLTQVPYQLRK